MTQRFSGGVAEWLKATDCKSVPTGTKVRILLPPPFEAGRETRGCSSMVELQPSKLATWVRFPSPAPNVDELIKLEGFLIFLFVE